MRLFYQSTAWLMIVLLIVATVIFLCGRKRKEDWWLIAFLASLVSNTVWALAEPILSGLGGLTDLVEIGALVARLVSVAGYCALFLFVVAHRRSSPNPN
jgi:hypothetical protein